MDKFRDKASEGIDQAKEKADERTGGKYSDKTERMADAVRQRVHGGEQTEQTGETQDTGEEATGEEATSDTEPLGMDESEEDQAMDEEESELSGDPYRSAPYDDRR